MLSFPLGVVFFLFFLNFFYFFKLLSILCTFDKVQMFSSESQRYIATVRSLQGIPDTL